MAASITRWRRACWARVSGRATVCSIPTAYPHPHLGLREAAPVRWCAMSRAHATQRRRPWCRRGIRGRAGRRRPTGGCPANAGRQTRQRLLDATVELLSTTSWRSVKVTDIARRARHVAGHLLPVLRERRAGHPGAGRGDGRPGGAVGRAGRRRLVRGGQLGHGAGRDRGVLGLLGGEPGRLPRGRPGHRGGRCPAARHPGPGPQRGDRRPGPGHRHRQPSPRRGPGTTTSSPAGADPMAVAGTLVAMFASVSAHRYGFEFWGIRTRHLVDTQARLLHWAVTGRAVPPAGPTSRPVRPPARAPDRCSGERTAAARGGAPT